MKTSLNLMTDDDRRRQMLADARRLWIRVLGGTVLALTAVGLFEWWQGSATTRKLAQLEERYEPVQTMKDECVQMRRDITAMQQAQQLTLKLVDTRPTVTLLGVVAGAAAETNGGVYVEKLDLLPESRGQEQRTAVLAGIGRDHGAIAKFTDSLRSSNLFVNVTLSSSDSGALGDSSDHAFRIECDL